MLELPNDVIPFAHGLRRLGVSRSQAYKLMADPGSDFLKPFRLGHRWAYRRGDIAAYLEKKARDANGGVLPGDSAHLVAALGAVAAILEGAKA